MQEPSIPQNEPPASPAPKNADDVSLGTALVELLHQVRQQRLDFVAENRLAAAERRSERRWRRLFFGAPLIIGILYFVWFVSATGFRWGPVSDVVGVVHIDGEIGANTNASAKKIVPLLYKAFESPRVKAVALSIDSPGGAPVESEQIANALDFLKKKHQKPVVSVVRNLGASAAYMIAIHTDEIYAGKYSLVGSIGAIMAPWDLHKAIEKVNVSQRVYASGKMKAFLNPFSEVTPEVDAKAQRLVSELGGTFVSEVKARRGKLLNAGTDYATGEVWSGTDAHKLGLIDGVDTLEQVVAAKWDLKIYDFGPSQEGLGILGSRVEANVLSLLEGLVQRQALRVQ
jgi:protease IV